MSVRIKEIVIKNLGPILKPVSFKLGLINILYGRNETGKTLLVEFLIKSLFRNKKQWMLRPINGTGKVVVEGITDKPVEFSPSSKNKLEDHFDKNIPGLPPDFSKLLVVKGAELEFSSAEGGIDKQIIKQYLSSKGVFEKIERNIPASIKNTKLEGCEILGPSRGDIKTRTELIRKIDRFHELVNKINEEYSGGYRADLEKTRSALQAQKDDLTTAKQHLAFRLSKEIEDFKTHLSSIDITALNEAGINILNFETKLKALNDKKEDQKEAQLKSRHYQWLSIAKKNYEELNRKMAGAQMPFLLIFTFLSIIASVIFILFKLNTGAIIAVSSTFISFFIYSVFKKRAASGSNARFEKEKLEKDFKNRINQNLESLTQLEELLLQQDDQHKRSEILIEQMNKESTALEELNFKISNFFKESFGKVIEQGQWLEKIAAEKNRIKKLTELINKNENELASLDVDKTDYKEAGSNNTYSKEKFNHVKQKLLDIENSIKEHDNKLENLKQSICLITGRDIFDTWEDILTEFYKTRDEAISSYNRISAGIIGQIIVHNVLEELKSEEDIKIIDSFKSKTIQEPLYTLTGRYKEITLEEEQLIVKDDYNDFLFNHLSTGTAEQILLALRLGFSSRLLAKDRLFLILDDSFQYSDWKRRPMSVKMMGELAKNGWQILCFTMDDHIKDLFEKTGKQFGNDFKSFEL